MKSSPPGVVWSCATAICCAGLLGCATHFDRIQPVRDAFHAGDLVSATARLEQHRDLRLRNQDVKQLDRAMIELASGRPESAERLLREVRDRFDALEEKSLLEQGASLLTDDNIKAYPGEDYERVLVRAFLALSSLMHGGDDASAYALQVTEKQDEIIRQATEKYKDQADAALAYKQVALGPYVRAMLAEESPLTLDEAARARLQVAEWAPRFRDAQSDLQRAKYEQPLPPGSGALYVFALLGRGPVKEQVAEIPTQVSMLIADRIISSCSNHGLPPTLAPVWVPNLTTCVTLPDNLTVEVDGELAGRTTTLLEIGRMAEAQHEARYPYIIATAVARRAVKKGVIWGVKEGLHADHGSLPSLALDVAGIAWEATESADTRCWSLLPDKIQVLRLELPAGDHDVRLQTARRTGPMGVPAHARVRIHDGRNTYMLGTFPQSDLVGQLLVSEQGK